MGYLRQLLQVDLTGRAGVVDDIVVSTDCVHHPCFFIGGLHPKRLEVDGL